MTLLPLELLLVVTWSTIVTWCWCLFDGCDCCWTFPFPVSTCTFVLKAGGAGAADIDPFSAASASLAAATMGSAADALTCMFVILLAARAAVAAVPVLGRTWLSQS